MNSIGSAVETRVLLRLTLGKSKFSELWLNDQKFIGLSRSWGINHKRFIKCFKKKSINLTWNSLTAIKSHQASTIYQQRWTETNKYYEGMNLWKQLFIEQYL